MPTVATQAESEDEGIEEVEGEEDEEGEEVEEGEEDGDEEHASERVQEEMKWLKEMGDLVDLSDEALALERSREGAVRQRVWTDLSEALSQRSYVYHLDLSRQHLKLLPAEIGKLNKVETCALAENDLSETSLPEEFFDLDRLRVLDISYNRFKTLPACICSFIDLEKINISGNEFQDPRSVAQRITAIFPDCQVVY